ncbi:hypothetical protein CFK37_02190 [Virgibacillus phasianinus]|uniref:Spore coat protein n=1 Tax=Virgibacillus phasianinus TaxID=2017483 RepID=A0A220TZ79_9BACI|nr:hypothetical protein [Virgibacillus phasianinus]ASK61089.1 hypothetical protein CFK37_02190 [Virgibacillus phasianinus]
MSNKENKNLSGNVIDLLVDSTLKKHGIKLEPEKLDDKQKEELKNMVNNLRKSVESLNQDKKESNDS